MGKLITGLPVRNQSHKLSCKVVNKLLCVSKPWRVLQILCKTNCNEGWKRWAEREKMRWEKKGEIMWYEKGIVITITATLKIFLRHCNSFFPSGLRTPLSMMEFLLCALCRTWQFTELLVVSYQDTILTLVLFYLTWPLVHLDQPYSQLPSYTLDSDDFFFGVLVFTLLSYPT